MLWLTLAGAFIVGVAKTSVGGLSVLSVLAFALAMPTKESTGAVLLVYLAGDLVATVRYRASVNWRMLGELVPWVLPGLALGAWFLVVVDGQALRRGIGVILAVSVVLHLALNRPRRAQPDAPRSRIGRWLGTAAAGLAAGFTTMAANAGGPVMTLYLLAKQVDKHVFVGTAAWFFFTINLSKLPFSIAVGAINADIAWSAVALAPVVWLGCLVGIRLLRIIPQRVFNGLALASSGFGAGVLMFG